MHKSENSEKKSPEELDLQTDRPMDGQIQLNSLTPLAEKRGKKSKFQWNDITNTNTNTSTTKNNKHSFVFGACISTDGILPKE